MGKGITRNISRKEQSRKSVHRRMNRNSLSLWNRHSTSKKVANFFVNPLDNYIPLWYNKVNQKKERERNEHLLYA